VRPVYRSQNFRLFLPPMLPVWLAQDQAGETVAPDRLEANYIRRTDAEMLRESFPSLRIRPANNGDIPADDRLEHRALPQRIGHAAVWRHVRKP